MAISVNTVADRIFNLLKGYGYAVDKFDKNGDVVGDPAEAIRFFVEDPNLLVTLNVSTEEIKLSVSENSEDIDTLRKQLDHLARDFLMNLDFRVFGKTLKPRSETVNVAKTKEKDMAVVQEASLGSAFGSTKTSYQPLDSVKIVVKHNKPVNEEIRGSRSRNISKIFIQANEERIAFPSRNLAGARAMARHIYNGGVMHDTIGESIVKMCEDLKTLRGFVGYVNKQGLVNEDNQTFVTLAKEHINDIKSSFKKLSGVKTYATAVESISEYSNVEILEDDIDLESKFTETHFDDKIANAVDTLKHLSTRRTAFESYIVKAIESETFDGIKDQLAESDVIDFTDANAKLGYQVSQLSNTAKDHKLASYLDSIGSKLNAGGGLDPFEYRAVKASLLSAGNNRPVYSESFSEVDKYEDFISSFVEDGQNFSSSINITSK